MSCVRYYAIALALLCLLLTVQLSSTQRCGKRKVVNFLIVNGKESKDGYWPWHAAIFHHNYLTSVYACGGTILSQNAVLTAAHCVMTTNGIIARKRVIVQVGRNRLGVATKRVEEHEAFELIVHPGYNGNDFQHDIALIKLATDITYTNYIQPICLWNRGEDLHTIIGSWGTVIGFGLDENDTVSQTLREASVLVVSHIACIESNREVFSHALTSNMLCAGNRDGISACNGDSGGGLFFNYNDVWFIRGMVSFTKPRQHGNNCDPKEYTAFTDVAKYLKWIEQHIPETSEQQRVAENDSSTKIGLLPMSTCGANTRKTRDESSKPVLLGYPWMGLMQGKIAPSKRDYDIALIRLRDRADTSQSNVKPICLPVTSELRSPHEPYYIVTLWYQYWLEKDNDHKLERSLHEVIELSKCQKQYKANMIDITAHHICVDQNQEPCNLPFPSAPLQLLQRVQGEYRYVLHGISSFRMPCHGLLPEVYINVAHFVDWILDNIEV
ncbi:serine protease 27-like [Anopheles moucheti]|uniref:serine protease 27-like n=1 Tax=Anopheles moucheti TaxID=186751 RepID=UPI0022F02E7E|nr:serine protease 27-like [Anopheles moucheti]